MILISQIHYGIIHYYHILDLRQINLCIPLMWLILKPVQYLKDNYFNFNFNYFILKQKWKLNVVMRTSFTLHSGQFIQFHKVFSLFVDMVLVRPEMNRV